LLLGTSLIPSIWKFPMADTRQRLLNEFVRNRHEADVLRQPPGDSVIESVTGATLAHREALIATLRRHEHTATRQLAMPDVDLASHKRSRGEPMVRGAITAQRAADRLGAARTLGRLSDQRQQRGHPARAALPEQRLGPRELGLQPPATWALAASDLADWPQRGEDAARDEAVAERGHRKLMKYAADQLRASVVAEGPLDQQASRGRLRRTRASERLTAPSN
jgi:hypothetical protein